MKKNWFRTVCIVVVFLVTIYYLLPLVVKKNYVKCDIEVYNQEDQKIYEVAEKDYKLGSNLFGPEFEEQISISSVNDSFLVSGRLPDKILRTIDTAIDYTKNQKISVKVVEKFSKVSLPTWFSDKQLKLGLDLQGGMHLVMSVETEGLSKDAAESSVKSALEIIRNRVDQFGVAEPTIQRIGDNRILVQLPGLRNARRAKDLIGKTALLEFNLLADNEDMSETVEAIDDYLQDNYTKYAYLRKIEKVAEEETALEETLFETEEEKKDSISIEGKEKKKKQIQQKPLYQTVKKNISFHHL